MTDHELAGTPPDPSTVTAALKDAAALQAEIADTEAQLALDVGEVDPEIRRGLENNKQYAEDERQQDLEVIFPPVPN